MPLWTRTEFLSFLGAPKSLETIHTRILPQLVRHFSGVLDVQDVEDALFGVLADYLGRAMRPSFVPRFEDADGFWASVFRGALYRCLSEARRKRRRERLLAKYVPPSEEQERGFDDVETRDAVEVISALLGKLTKREARVLLSYLEGKKPDEIAFAEGKSSGATRAVFQRAVHKLRIALIGEEKPR